MEGYLFFILSLFLQRYEEASQAFSEVLKLEGSYAEAAQELLQMQIMQLMVCCQLKPLLASLFFRKELSKKTNVKLMDGYLWFVSGIWFHSGAVLKCFDYSWNSTKSIRGSVQIDQSTR